MAFYDVASGIFEALDGGGNPFDHPFGGDGFGIFGGMGGFPGFGNGGGGGGFGQGGYSEIPLDRRQTTNRDRTCV